MNRGLRWNTRNITHDTDILLPADGGFSIKIKKLGFWVAWNDKYTVINWGHNVKEWADHLDYYLEVYRAKAAEGEEAMKQRLIDNGYDLRNVNGKYEIIKKSTNHNVIHEKN